MDIVFNFYTSIGQYPGQSMSTWLPSNLPLPARAFMILQVHCVPFLIVPMVQKGDFSYVIITHCNFYDLELVANQIQFFHDIRQNSFWPLTSQFLSQVSLFHYELPQLVY